jgi:hypothetical protein
MSALREIFARFGVDFATDGLEKGNSAVGSLTGRLQELGNVLMGGAAVVALRSFVQDIAHTGDELHNASIALGLNTDRLQEWRAAAGQAGVASEQLTPAIQAVRRNADAARIAGGQMARDFRALGVRIRGEHGGLRQTDEILRDMADGFQNMPDPTRRAAIAMRLMGEQGARLLPILEQGSEGVDASAEAFRELGGGMSEDAIEAAREYTAQVRAMDAAFTGIKSRIAVYLLPFLTRLLDGITALEAGFSRASDKGRLLEATALAVGVAAAAAGARTAAGWVAAAAPFVVLGALIFGTILLVEDLMIGLEGGKSTLAEWGDGFEEWAASATGAMEPVAGFLLFIRDMIRAAVNEIADFLGMGDDVLGLYQAPPQEQRRNAMEEVRRIRAERARAAEALEQGETVVRGSEALVQGSGVTFRTAAGAAPFDLSAFGGAGGSRGGAPAVQQSVQIGRVEVDARGQDPEVISREVERGIRQAMQREADDTLDTLTQGA